MPRIASAPACVRFVENLGAEHVLHAEYGEDLIRVVTSPGFAAEDETIHLALPGERIHLIDARSEDVVSLTRCGTAP